MSLTVQSLKGHFLIAVPDLADQNFFRTVVLMLQHDQQGAMGVILNRPAEVVIGKIWNQIFSGECDCDEPIYVGGPVEGPLMLLHLVPTMSDIDIVDGVSVAFGKTFIESIISANQRPYRLFSGYSGWGAGQLEREIQQGGWLTMPAEMNDIFAPPDDLWKTVCETFGTEVIKPQLGKNVKLPSDPSLN